MARSRNSSSGSKPRSLVVGDSTGTARPLGTPIVTVIGSGVTGLSAAHELAERGFRVQVVEPRCSLDDEYAVEVGGIAATQWRRVKPTADRQLSSSVRETVEAQAIAPVPQVLVCKRLDDQGKPIPHGDFYDARWCDDQGVRNRDKVRQVARAAVVAYLTYMEGRRSERTERDGLVLELSGHSDRRGGTSGDEFKLTFDAALKAAQEVTAAIREQIKEVSAEGLVRALAAELADPTKPDMSPELFSGISDEIRRVLRSISDADADDVASHVSAFWRALVTPDKAPRLAALTQLQGQPQFASMDDPEAIESVLAAEVGGGARARVMRTLVDRTAGLVVTNVAGLGKGARKQAGIRALPLAAHLTDLTDLIQRRLDEAVPRVLRDLAWVAIDDDPTKPPPPIGRGLRLRPIGRGSDRPIVDDADPSLRPRNNRIQLKFREERLPGDHGYRFFPAFYRHLFDTMRRTPLYEPGLALERVESERTAFDNLVSTTTVGIAMGDGAAPVAMQRRKPTSFEEVRRTLRDMEKRLGMTRRDLSLYEYFFFKYLTSCAARREQYESGTYQAGDSPSRPTTTWWDFIGADGYSQGFRTQLRAMSQALIAMRERDVDIRTFANIAVQLMMDQSGDGAIVDLTLNGPTSEAWFDHWKYYLKRIGVHFFRGRLGGLRLERIGDGRTELRPVFCRLGNPADLPSAMIEARPPRSTATARFTEGPGDPDGDPEAPRATTIDSVQCDATTGRICAAPEGAGLEPDWDGGGLACLDWLDESGKSYFLDLPGGEPVRFGRTAVANESDDDFILANPSHYYVLAIPLDEIWQLLARETDSLRRAKVFLSASICREPALEYRKDRGFFATLSYFDHVPLFARRGRRDPNPSADAPDPDYPVAERDTYDGSCACAVFVSATGHVTLVDQDGTYVFGVHGSRDDHYDLLLVAICQRPSQHVVVTTNLTVFVPTGWTSADLDRYWDRVLELVYRKRQMDVPRGGRRTIYVDARLERAFEAMGPTDHYRFRWHGRTTLNRSAYLTSPPPQMSVEPAHARVPDATYVLSPATFRFRSQVDDEIFDQTYFIDPAGVATPINASDTRVPVREREAERSHHLVLASSGQCNFVLLVHAESFAATRSRDDTLACQGLTNPAGQPVVATVRFVARDAFRPKTNQAGGASIPYAYVGPGAVEERIASDRLEGAFRQLDTWRRSAEPSSRKRWGLDKKPDGSYLHGGPFRDLSGMQFYFDYDFKFWKGHSFHPNSEYGVSSIAQKQFWRVRRLNGGYRSMLSVDLGDLYSGNRAPLGIREAGPRYPHPDSIWRLSRREMQQNVWQQLMLGFDLTLGVHVPRASYFHVDDFIEYGLPRDLDSTLRNRLKRGFAFDQVPIRNNAPFLVNLPGDWAKRPLASRWTRSLQGIYERPQDRTTCPPGLEGTLAWYPVDHQRWVIAGPHMRTYTRMTTMEAANESARHAVNRILYHMGIELRGDRETRERRGFGTSGVLMGDFCEVWDPEENEVQDLAFMKRIDEELVKAGLPHFTDILGLEKLVEGGLSFLDSISSAVGAAKRFGEARPGPNAFQIPGLAAKTMERDWGENTYNLFRGLVDRDLAARFTGSPPQGLKDLLDGLAPKGSAQGGVDAFSGLTQMLGGSPLVELLKALAGKRDPAP